MSAAVQEAVPASPSQLAPRVPRLWLPLAIVVLYWAFIIGLSRMEMPFFHRFLQGMVAPALLFLTFSVWWLSRPWIARSDRWLGYALTVGLMIPTSPLTHPSIGIWTAAMLGLPMVISLWIVWCNVIQRTKLAWMSVPPRPAKNPPVSSGVRWGSLILVCSAWSSLMLIRIEGYDGDLQASIYWRWTPTAEELFLVEAKAAAKRASNISKPEATVAKPEPSAAKSTAVAEKTGTMVSKKPATAAAPLIIAPDDWPGFRGPQRDGIVHGLTIATDWKAAPPKLLWQQRLGPAWSSMAIVGERLFTQEQRGDLEAVVCYDASTGVQLWAHEDATRFWEGVSGAGPRATPEISESRLYSLGATGIVNCLDAVTGDKFWSHDLVKESAATLPVWGFSSSPVVTHGLVIVYGGGDKDNLHALSAKTGKPVWTASAGTSTYGSPQLATIDGHPQVLVLGDLGLFSFEPSTGEKLWQAGVAMPGAPRSLQPHVVNGTRVVTGTLEMGGTGAIDVQRGQEEWKVKPCWNSTQVKPEFSDFVMHEGHAYGFDGAIFCCADLATGDRDWKGGRYGRGQVVLLSEQGLLMVLSETGSVVLVSAEPDKHHELGKFQAIPGKTWNHPAVSHGRLYVRNAEWMACYDLRPASAVAATDKN